MKISFQFGFEIRLERAGVEVVWPQPDLRNRRHLRPDTVVGNDPATGTPIYNPQMHDTYDDQKMRREHAR